MEKWRRGKVEVAEVGSIRIMWSAHMMLDQSNKTAQ